MEKLLKTYHDINGKVIRRSIYVAVRDRAKSEVPDPERSAYESRRAAFQKASLKIQANSDLVAFVTLTYDPKKSTSPHYLDDIKNLFTRRGIKYVAVFEKHKNNPNLHIHAITSNIETYVNSNGYESVKGWHKGFSSVKWLSGTDDNFRVQKYIFKYMKKGVKVKHKYVYSSRGLLPEPLTIRIDEHSSGIEFMQGLQVRKYVLQSGYTMLIGERS